MMRKSFCCLLFITIFVLPLTAKTIKVKSYKSLQRQLVHTNSTYILSNTFNLKGDTLAIPYGCTLVFKKGGIKNGVVVGDSSRVKAGKINIFNTVSILGSWQNDTVYSEWLDFIPKNQYDNRNNFQNLMTLSNGKRFKRVYMQKGEFWTSVRNYGYGIKIPSNTCFHSEAMIKEIANDYKYACLISINRADNVIIDGGKYVGDVRNHTDKGGEWSHGIECRASSNIIIKNVECNEFWGDGIDVIDGYDNNNVPRYDCRNVLIEAVKCCYNRRQGISIEAVQNCTVRNSEFSYTGKIKHTDPAAGIDIEAWSKVTEKIKDVIIENCTMKENYGFAFQCYANAIYGDKYDSYVNNIQVKNCKMESVLLHMTNGIEFEGCDITEKQQASKIVGLKYRQCKLRGQNYNRIVTRLL